MIILLIIVAVVIWNFVGAIGVGLCFRANKQVCWNVDSPWGLTWLSVLGPLMLVVGVITFILDGGLEMPKYKIVHPFIAISRWIQG